MAQVTVYTTTTCPYCVMAKNFLRAQGIPFKEVNVELDPAYKEIRQTNMGKLHPTEEEQREMEIGPNRCAVR
ncbi:glutaredoxin domain-containing protein [Geobacillus zalihae]|uniref:Glutaredoxin domain-containing protein n=1 Tax=Geobacillus zalihae TaxID=213419 RepID=A0A7H1RYA1_9BACL|nr:MULTISPECIES: glutaredoxin domain-containing protein [Geobacillus]EPR27650.1 Glutaredoxin [Geobacillus sp. WSUCF1]OQP17032.1 hypothetical protein B1693_05425 [Geobacillus zalihae]OQP21197.1 hypothetical protein B1694_12480 [Geobacillus zalihae]QNU19240.1 hypothetical protein IC807_06405 [Geobacillus zalihae]WKA46153.1 glutaredoxin domain-containing protein [Geobacillus zalihae]